MSIVPLHSESSIEGTAVGDPGTGLGTAVGKAEGAAVGVAVVREASTEKAKSNTGVLGRKGISFTCPRVFYNESFILLPIDLIVLATVYDDIFGTNSLNIV